MVRNLIMPKPSPTQANALLNKEHWAWGVQLDGDCYDRKDRQEHDEGDGGAEDV